MGLLPLTLKSYGPFGKSMGRMKRNMEVAMLDSVYRILFIFRLQFSIFNVIYLVFTLLNRSMNQSSLTQDKEIIYCNTVTVGKTGPTYTSLTHISLS